MTIRTLELLACLALLCLFQKIAVSASSSTISGSSSIKTLISYNSLPKSKPHGLIKKTIGKWGTLPSEKKQLLQFRGGEQSDIDDYDSETESDTDSENDYESESEAESDCMARPKS